MIDQTETQLKVAERQNLNDEVIELVFEAADGAPLPGWQPGSHIALKLGNQLVRQYSLVPDGDGRWKIAVLVEPNGRGGSMAIKRKLTPGATVTALGPRNHFPFEIPPRHPAQGDLSPQSQDLHPPKYLFIAGGIGVTPLIAMCRAAQADGAEWRLLYGGRARTSMAYLTDLEAEFPENLTVFDQSADEIIDIPAQVAALEPGEQVYVCGPEPLLAAVEDAMAAAGRLGDLHLERFAPRADDGATDNYEFTVVAERTGLDFVVPDDESILMAADFEGIEVPGDCMEGTCGTCITRIITGEVEHRDSVLSQAERDANQVMMICVSRAKYPCKELVLDL